ncbi:hypothetical protein R1sor_026351 [Riccia sorocarpa]|uniref:Fe2OG dioxygenase domain-containing protein n=1 Tax=Riccia sorocarpa TaxID=122646 RepID=A0ABD3GBS2_9MARC
MSCLEIQADVKRFVPVSVKQLAEEGAPLPEKFLKKGSECPTTAHTDFCKEIPVISFEGLDTASGRQRILSEVGRACAEWGIFQIVDHGVPENLMKRMMDNGLAFFNLPLEEKIKYASPPGSFPVGYLSASGIHRNDNDTLGWREVMAQVSLPKDIREIHYSSWPQNPADYKKTLVEYSDTIDQLVTCMLGLISESLGLPSDYIKNVSGGEKMGQKIAFNYYPHCPQSDLALGLKSHTDHGTITVIQQDQVGGLQVYKEDRDKWGTVEPIPGALVINLGDQIQILSNGRYCSVEHQAVVNSSQSRVSIATFAKPELMSRMGPAPELLSETSPARYRNITFKDYLPICFAMKTKKNYDALII